jgi:murein DD-endopeptidase MepM/ murein hydrolase activator NlpD
MQMQMVLSFPPRPAMGALLLAGMLAGCGGGPNDWDLRTNGSGTADVATSVAGARPTPDANGVISYPTYQVAVARQGDTVSTLATRIGVEAGQLAAYNALKPTDNLHAGEILALPTRVATASATPVAGGLIGTTAPGGGIDVASIATSAIDNATASGNTGSVIGATPTGPAVPFQPAQPGPEPLRHQVARGETAFTIARLYNVSAKDLADWNGLGPDFAVREGQYLLIPTTTLPVTPVAATNTQPGQGTPTPEPPSASAPLPDEKTQTVAEVAKTVPPAPDLGSQRTSASAAQFAMPVAGAIIRTYQKGKNDGIDISAAAGTPVKAAADGTVAAVTKDTEGTPILVIRHADNLLTVYAGIDGVTLVKGDAVKRGQVLGVVKAGSPSFLHFEVRQGIDSVDPTPYLQ